MKVSELKDMIDMLTGEELNMDLEIVFSTADAVFTTDSVRFDFDGGRVIGASKSSPGYESNKMNQEIELSFLQRRNQNG